MCLNVGFREINGKLLLRTCYGFYGNHFFAFENSGQIITSEEYCVGINHLNEVILVHCTDTDKTQRWTFDQKVGSHDFV